MDRKKIRQIHRGLAKALSKFIALSMETYPTLPSGQALGMQQFALYFRVQRLVEGGDLHVKLGPFVEIVPADRVLGDLILPKVVADKVAEKKNNEPPTLQISPD